MANHKFRTQNVLYYHKLGGFEDCTKLICACGWTKISSSRAPYQKHDAVEHLQEVIYGEP